MQTLIMRMIADIAMLLSFVWLGLTLPIACIMRDGWMPGSVESHGLEAWLRTFGHPFIWPALIVYVVSFVFSFWLRRRRGKREMMRRRHVVTICIFGMLIVVLFACLVVRLFWWSCPEAPRDYPKSLSTGASELPIRDFKWDELRLGDVAGMEERYSTRVGKVFSPSGGVAPRVDVAKYMKELRLPTVSFKPPATLADALLYLQSASVPFDGSGQVVLFALKPKKEGEVYPTVPEMRVENILFADIFRLVCEVTNVRYEIRDDGVVVVKPKDWTCDDGCKPGEVWLLQEGAWPRGDVAE